MSKEIERLSKDLARGMSRRKALWRFALGAGAVGGLGLLTRKKASAANLFYCLEVTEEFYGCCLSEGAPQNVCLIDAEKVYERCLSDRAAGGVVLISGCRVEFS